MLNKKAVVLWGLVLGINFNLQADETKNSPENKSCKTILSPVPMPKGGQSLKSFSAKLEVYSLRALTDVSDPKKNLAYQHPTIVMDAQQIYQMAVRHYPKRTILDPTYPIREWTVYPIFSDGVQEAGGARIVGQYEALSELVDYMSSVTAGKGLMFVGPGGTGKTELLTVLDGVVDRLSTTEPDSYEYTFRWKNLDQIPFLKPLVADEFGNLHITPMKRSPLTLLPREIQEKIVNAAAPRVRGILDADPHPFLTPDPQSAEIINAIIAHAAKERGLTEITEEDYISILENHVDVVRRLPDPTLPPGIIRFQDKHADPSQLFFSENIYLKQIYGLNSALSYDYNGVVPRRDGRGVFFDELFRNSEGLLNTLLEVIQNSVLESGSAPPLVLNSLFLAATNDESIEKARTQFAIKANLDRIKKVPMRQPIHPGLVAPIALIMNSKGRMNEMFKMRKLDTDELVPADINQIYSLPNENGEIFGPEGRVALYATPKLSKKILITPHALELLAMTVAGTRMVTDPKALKSFVAELNVVGPESHLFTSVRNRLEVITRQVRPVNAVLYELTRLNRLTLEGEGGISARDAERWLSHAINIADKSNGALTPVVMDKAFRELIDTGGFVDNKSELRARWIHIYQTIKSTFLLNSLTTDVQTIIGQEGGVARDLYEDVRSEALALADSSDAEFRFDSNGEKRPINHDRYMAISKIYEELNGSAFTPGTVKSFDVKPGGAVFEPLMRAVKQYVLTMQMNMTASNGNLSFLDDKKLSRYGYDLQSFQQIHKFIADEQLELKSRK